MNNKITIKEFDMVSDAFSNPKTLPVICEVANKFNTLSEVINPVTSNCKDLYFFMCIVLAIMSTNRNECGEYLDVNAYQDVCNKKAIYYPETICFDCLVSEKTFLLACAATSASTSIDAIIKLYGGESAYVSCTYDTRDLYGKLVDLTIETCIYKG